jgi:hypothetical protein
MNDCDTECLCFWPEQFEGHLVSLFELQGLLLNDAIALSFADSCDEILDLCRDNLYDNVHEIGIAFASAYGSRVGSEVEKLWMQQTNLTLAQLQAVFYQDPKAENRFLMEAYANGSLFIEFLSILTPYFSAQGEKYMMDEHVSLQSEQIKAYSRGLINRGEEFRCRSVDQLVELALHISKAIEKEKAG